MGFLANCTNCYRYVGLQGTDEDIRVSLDSLAVRNIASNVDNSDNNSVFDKGLRKSMPAGNCTDRSELSKFIVGGRRRLPTSLRHTRKINNIATPS